MAFNPQTSALSRNAKKRVPVCEGHCAAMTYNDQRSRKFREREYYLRASGSLGTTNCNVVLPLPFPSLKDKGEGSLIIGFATKGQST